MAEKKINGRTVRYDRLPADQGLKMLLRVLKVLGPLKGVIEMIAADEDTSNDFLPLAAIGTFSEAMDSDEVYRLVMDMVKHCHVDGTPAVPGIMDLMELLEVAFFAFRTEYSAFFDEGAESVLQRVTRAA